MRLAKLLTNKNVCKMSNVEKLNAILLEVFPALTAADLNDKLNKCSVDGWDSVHILHYAVATVEL